MTSPSIQVSVFPQVPAFAHGLVRDLRVRWALEEAGIPYSAWQVGSEERKSASYRRMQPFGQVPAYVEDGFELFESGAIVLHVAERSEALMPTDRNSRTRIIAWMFAALNTVEPPIQNLFALDTSHAAEEWAKARRPALVEEVKVRLTSLASWLEGRNYLVDHFSAADVVMTTVLRFLRHTDLLAQVPIIEAYRQRCESRSAFQKALAAQLAVFEQNASRAA
jgi:glutathione S-transferase